MGDKDHDVSALRIAGRSPTFPPRSRKAMYILCVHACACVCVFMPSRCGVCHLYRPY